MARPAGFGSCYAFGCCPGYASPRPAAWPPLHIHNHVSPGGPSRCSALGQSPGFQSRRWYAECWNSVAPWQWWLLSSASVPLAQDSAPARMSPLGRKPPLGDHGWISSPERRETAYSVEKVEVFGRCLRMTKMLVRRGASNCFSWDKVQSNALSASLAVKKTS